MPTEESEAGASKPENLDQAVPTPGPGTIDPFLLKPATPGERLIVPNVSSIGSGPQPSPAEFWRVGPLFVRFDDVN
jgi:hypothetical protein